MMNLVSVLEKNRWLRYLVTVAIIAVTFSCLNVHKYYVLTMRGKPAEAVIVKTDAAPSIDHAPCGATYQYKMDGGGYTDTRIFGNGACLIPVGSRHSIYYDPENPEEILIDQNPQSALANEVIGILIVSFLLPGIFWWIEAIAKAKRAKAIQSSLKP